MFSYLKGEAVVPDPVDPDEKFRSAMETLKGEIDQATPHGRERFLYHWADVCDVTQKVKTAKKASEYARYTQMEGKPTAMLLFSLLPDEFKQHPNARRFAKLLLHLTRAINNLDSVVDLKGDKAEGQTQVQGPDLYVKARLVSAVAGDLFYVAPKIIKTKRARTEIARVFREGVDASKIMPRQEKP